MEGPKKSSLKRSILKKTSPLRAIHPGTIPEHEEDTTADSQSAKPLVKPEVTSDPPGDGRNPEPEPDPGPDPDKVTLRPKLERSLKDSFRVSTDRLSSSPKSRFLKRRKRPDSGSASPNMSRIKEGETSFPFPPSPGVSSLSVGDQTQPRSPHTTNTRETPMDEGRCNDTGEERAGQDICKSLSDKQEESCTMESETVGAGSIVPGDGAALDLITPDSISVGDRHHNVPMIVIQSELLETDKENQCDSLSDRDTPCTQVREISGKSSTENHRSIPQDDSISAVCSTETSVSATPVCEWVEDMSCDTSYGEAQPSCQASDQPVLPNNSISENSLSSSTEEPVMPRDEDVSGNDDEEAPTPSRVGPGDVETFSSDVHIDTGSPDGHTGPDANANAGLGARADAHADADAHARESSDTQDMSVAAGDASGDADVSGTVDAASVDADASRPDETRKLNTQDMCDSDLSEDDTMPVQTGAVPNKCESVSSPAPLVPPIEPPVEPTGVPPAEPPVVPPIEQAAGEDWIMDSDEEESLV